MENLVIKPTLACTAKCPTCASRRLLHKEARQQQWLTFADWERILTEAKNLGSFKLTISGGEPTLYKQLPDLIKLGRRFNWFIWLNSNGSFTQKENAEHYAEELIKSGLTLIDLSLYSPDPSVHDRMRASKGLWQKATAAFKIFSDLQPKYPDFTIISQSILCHENYTDFAELLALHYRLGSSGMLLSYLEGDFEKKHLFTEEEIHHFRNSIIPKAIKVCEEFDPYVKDIAISNIRRIFSDKILDTVHWAKGIYRPDRGICKIPQQQALILANGDVHPCNIVEYTHGPVMGNVFEHSLSEIYYGLAWQNFRHYLHEHCDLCAMNNHVYIPLRPPKEKLIALLKAWMHKLHLQHVDKFMSRKVKVYKVRILNRLL